MIKRNLIDGLKKIVKDENILLNESMKNHCTFKCGGNAEIFVNVLNIDQLVEVLKYLNKEEEKYIILGRGSNILVKDGGIDGVVISTSKMNDMEIDGDMIKANAGVTLALISIKAMENSLSGFEFACSIPGSLGGGVFMNAGAHGGELKDVLYDVDVFDGEKIITLTPDKLDLSYRHSNIYEKGYIVLSARIKLKKGNKDEIKKKMEEFKDYRKRTQPSFPSAGSTFKRPKGYIAAKLIDDLGLKGYHIADAWVSEKHAGFVVNKGNASAKEILEVIDYVKKAVYNEYKVKLEEEVRILGEDC